VIKTADYIIDLGPLGGDRGGELIATGTPEEIAVHPKSYTGQYLRPILEAAGTLAPGEAAATNGKKPRARKAVSAPVAEVRVAAGGRNGASEALATGPAPEESAARAAASIAARIERESAPQPERPPTKAAEKRARQAAKPRKETASERALREKRGK
jgi:excinuclease ABC subunit A